MAEGYVIDQCFTDNYAVYHGDCVMVLPGVPDNSIHHIVYSPPFSSLFQYSPSVHDLGNCQSESQFFLQHAYVADHLLRVLLPGRVLAMHVSEVPGMLIRDGWIGLHNFRGHMTDHMVKRGWIKHGEVVITKNPQAQSIRTHPKGLSFTQLKKDASWMRPALVDYILLFRKPGENPVPVMTDVDNETWIHWANGAWYDFPEDASYPAFLFPSDVLQRTPIHLVWYGAHDEREGIRETDTLNAAEAREHTDDKHICPLQLGVIERCIRLWSNRGETILSPFGGIGSEGFIAIQQGRKFVGIELKTSYYTTMIKNLDRAQQTVTQLGLF